LGAGVLLIVGILIFNRGGGEDETPPDAPIETPAPTLDDSSKPAPLVGGERPEIKHAEAWEKSAEALGEIDKHLNRAKLIFQDIDAAGAQASVGGAPPDGGSPDEATGGGAAGEPAQQAAPRGPDPGQVEAQRIWTDWASDWATDLKVITGMLPPPELVDTKLAAGYSAVAELISACRRLPSGNPPGKGARDSWLRGLQNKSVAVRATLEGAR
jgi:hypothetical protein